MKWSYTTWKVVIATRVDENLEIISKWIVIWVTGPNSFIELQHRLLWRGAWLFVWGTFRASKLQSYNNRESDLLSGVLFQIMLVMVWQQWEKEWLDKISGLIKFNFILVCIYNKRIIMDTHQPCYLPPPAVLQAGAVARVRKINQNFLSSSSNVLRIMEDYLDLLVFQ